MSRLRPSPCALGLALLTALMPAGCGGGAPSSAPEPEAPEIFADRAPEAGIDFVHQNGACGRLYMAEVMGSGAALFDYDNDGDLDAYLVQSGALDPDPECRFLFPSPESMEPLTDRLYRNDLVTGGDGAPRLRFTDVTAASGLAADGYGMGVATGDYDNDGWLDLYVTNLGSNQLWRNNGDGTFADVTADAGVDDPRWSTSAAFVDFDADGWLDLFVASYVEFTVAGRQHCTSLTGARDYCGPLAYRPLPDRFFRNRGDGTFDGLVWSGAVGAKPGAGLGVASGDFDDDGRLDLYIANDGMPNFLWMSDPHAVLADQGMLSGSALNREGQAEAGMGVAVADIDADGDEDVLVTHLALETNTLYRNLGGAVFDDQSTALGIGAASWSFTGFGTAWLDFDNDGWQDLVTVNGAVKIIPELAAAGDPYPLRMDNQLFRSIGGQDFEDVSSRGGRSFSQPEVSRGVATGDVDNDGDVDILLANNNGPARLLVNLAGQNRPWIGVRALDPSGRRDRLGAWIGVVRSGIPTQYRRVRTDGSYLSASDPRILVGLGNSPAVDSVVVRWPTGAWERYAAEAGRYTDLVEGEGEAIDDPR